VRVMMAIDFFTGYSLCQVNHHAGPGLGWRSIRSPVEMKRHIGTNVPESD
jgi:hypothetical protein